MAELLRIRGAVLSLLEKARGDKYVLSQFALLRCSCRSSVISRKVKNSLEAEVDILVPDDTSEDVPLVELLRREGQQP